MMLQSAIESVFSRLEETDHALDDLAALFGDIDKTYNRIATSYRFQCNGCSDNCCETLFYHHTLLEYLYLLKGFRSLENEARQKAMEKAFHVSGLQKKSETEETTQRLRILCPLNSKGLCITYPYRPMICRMHGIPSEMRFPNGKKSITPGCGLFHQNQSSKSYITFDRTPYYIELAKQEKNVRLTMGFNEKIKMTVAQMLISMAELL